MASRASTVADIQINAAATVLAEALHYCRQQAWGMPSVNWHSLDAVRKQTLIEHAAYFLERLKPIVERPKLAMVKAPSPNVHRGSEELVCSRAGGEISGEQSDDDEAFCLYCSCSIDPDHAEHTPFCCALCAIGAEVEGRS